MKNRFVLVGLASLCLASLAVSSIAIASVAAFVKTTEERGGAEGAVGLRNYYQKGDGSSSDPFVISRPIHFYNLSRLQSLGVYSDPTQPKFFQLGYDPTGGNNLKFYESDASETMINYLDMSAYDGTTAAKTIHPIGSEAFPFSGRFDGKNLQISNLKVIGDTQDVGVFGYTSSSSRISNVLFDNLTVSCRGYNTNDFGDLFSSNVAPNIKINGVEISGSTSVDVLSQSPLEIAFIEPASNGYTYTISAACEYLTPSSNRKTLSLVASGPSSVFSLFDSYEGDYEKTPTVFDRVSVIAHKIVDGVSTARVVSIYDASFSKASAVAPIQFNVRKVSAENHGCNIGLIIGHCDGSISRAFVHEGYLDINPTINGYTTLPQKSEYGLIGMVGASIGNSYKGGDGTAGIDGGGVGVAHFTDIYKNIVADNATFTDVGGGYYTYEPKEGTAFDAFLRYRNENDTFRYTSASKTVSLRGLSVIRDGIVIDEKQQDFGLGVFTIVTDTTTPGNGPVYYGANIDRCVIEQDNAPTNEIYYTTAEWVNSSLESQTTWGGSDKTGTEHIHPGYYIPTEYDSDPDYHKNLNFIFKTQITDADSRWYFADALASTAGNSHKGGDFLGQYFESKLVDATGTSIPKTDARCGVMIKDRDKNNIASFSASLRLPRKGNDGPGSSTSNQLHYMADPKGGDDILISRTVNFTIDKALANVTVVAKKKNADDQAKIGIYRVDDIEGVQDSTLTNRNYDKPDYAMYIPKDDDFVYFDYQDGKVGHTDPKTGSFVESRYANINGTTEGKLFAHTFKLPAGRYAIASAGNTECNLYYVCAQGQENGDFDIGGTMHSLVNTVDLVDFAKVPAYKIEDGVAVPYFNWASPELGRCFISLDADKLSRFGDGHLELSFVYNSSDNGFYVQAGNPSQLSQIERISTLNYAQLKSIVHLMNLTPSDSSELEYTFT